MSDEVKSSEAVAEANQAAATPKVEESKPSTVKIPSDKELLKAGVQFGHESKRWNPKMSRYIYGTKNNIHIIDIQQTETKLKEAADFLKSAASQGQVLFVGTKRQASELVKREAIRVGAYFVDERWAGGILTNFQVVKKSLDKLNLIERQLEEGVQDRTKYEVSRMKKEWQRLSRLYSGIKALNQKPTAVVIIDSNFERSVVKEARKIKIPVVGIIDSNCDPESVDYVVPANDDAIGSIDLILKTLADGVLEGNQGKGVVHNMKDYTKVEVKIVKTEDATDEIEKVDVEEGASEETPTQPHERSEESVKSKSVKSTGKAKGILERVKDEQDAKKAQK
jgi:small subunit ribosomal protein S2